MILFVILHVLVKKKWPFFLYSKLRAYASGSTVTVAFATKFQFALLECLYIFLFHVLESRRRWVMFGQVPM